MVPAKSLLSLRINAHLTLQLYGDKTGVMCNGSKPIRRAPGCPPSFHDDFVRSSNSANTHELYAV
jgi:hypothetical protein